RLKKQKRSKCHCVPSVRDSNSPSEQKERARRTSRYSKYGFRILKNYDSGCVAFFGLKDVFVRYAF
ncbi:MAG: hypothetical protein ABH879_04740, partial [archaeon]